MTQAIDPVKLKAAAEHPEWVLKQYPNSEDVQSLLCTLTPLIEDAKAGWVLVPVNGADLPGAWNFGDGRTSLTTIRTLTTHTSHSGLR